MFVKDEKRWRACGLFAGIMVIMSFVFYGVISFVDDFVLGDALTHYLQRSGEEGKSIFINTFAGLGFLINYIIWWLACKKLGWWEGPKRK